MESSPLRPLLPIAARDLAREARRDALAALHARAAQRVFGYVWRRTGDRHLAEDLASDVFVRAFERLPDLTPCPASEAWLLRVASNLVNQWARRKRLVGWLTLGAGDTEPAGESMPSPASADPDPDVERLRGALLRLPTRFQAVLALRYVEGLEPEEVARVLALPLGTVHSRLARGRERLRRTLGGGHSS